MHSKDVWMCGGRDVVPGVWMCGEGRWYLECGCVGEGRWYLQRRRAVLGVNSRQSGLLMLAEVDTGGWGVAPLIS